MPTIKELRDRKSALFSRLALWNNIYTQIGRYVVPFRNEINRIATEGAKRTEFQYDSTAPNALAVASSAIDGTLTSSSTRWFGIYFTPESLNELEGSGTWRDIGATQTFKRYSQSNFYAELPQVYADLLSFGIGCLFVDELNSSHPGPTFNGFLFKSYAPGTFAIAEDSEGFVDTVYVRFKMSVRAAAAKWGVSKLSRRAGEMFRTKPDQDLDLIHAVQPREGVDPTKVTLMTPAKRLPVASYYFEESGDSEIIHEGGYHEMPFMVPRWAKSSGEVYGRSPTMNALADIRTLNRAVELRLKAWAKAIDPPLLVRDRGVVGKISSAAAALNSVRDMDAVRELVTGAKFDVANFSEEQLRDSIRKAYFIDQIQFPPMQGTPPSATEVSIRFETMQRIFGPALGRIMHELLGKMTHRAIRLQLRRGALPPLPPEVAAAIQHNVVRLDVNYEGPLARAQRASDIDAVTRVYAILAPLKEIEPQVMSSLKHKEVGRYVAEAASFPPSLVYTKAEQEAILEAQAAAAQEAHEAVQAQDMARSVGQLAPALKVAQDAAMAEGQLPTRGTV